MADLSAIAPRGVAEPATPLELAAEWRRPSVRIGLIVAALTCIGVVAVASAGGAGGFAGALSKRLALTAIGAAAFAAGASVPHRWWRRHHLAVLAFALAGLVAVLIPGVGVRINNARRWINPGLPVGFQPSEFAKVALCVWVAAYCERNATRMRSAVHGFLAPLSVVGLACLLILAEPDFGTAALAGLVCLAVLLVFGTRLVYVLLAGAAGAPLLRHLVLEVPYRYRRIVSFLNPWADPRGSGYQLIQSRIAIGSGGVFGRGLGAGVQKAGFLPGADNDFIFSILAEELGLVGCLVVLALFALLLWECLKVVLRAPDAFAFALALGLALLLGFEAAAHVAVVTGTVPTKGLSMPFISAGGSSLIASLLAAGMIMRVALVEEGRAPGGGEGWPEREPAYERAARRWSARLADACLRGARRALGKGGPA